MLDGLINVLVFVTGTLSLYGLATLVRPFWVVKTRWQGLLLVIGGVMGGGLVGSIPPSRPADVTPKVWARRVAICDEAKEARTCPRPSAEVAATEESLGQAKAARTGSAEVRQASSPQEIKPSSTRTQETMLDLVRPCDQAIVRASKTYGRYASYGNKTGSVGRRDTPANDRRLESDFERRALAEVAGAWN